MNPDDQTQILILMVRQFDALRHWDNRIPVRSDGVRLVLRAVTEASPCG